MFITTSTPYLRWVHYSVLVYYNPLYFYLFYGNYSISLYVVTIILLTLQIYCRLSYCLYLFKSELILCVYIILSQLVFVVFTGEAWGYLGSRRFLVELDQHSDAISGLNHTLVETVCFCLVRVKFCTGFNFRMIKLANESWYDWVVGLNLIKESKQSVLDSNHVF